MEDVPPDHAARLISQLVDEPSGIGDEPTHYDEAIFEKIPKSYIETTYDRIITLATQRRIQREHKFHFVLSLPTSHSPFFSQPKALAKAIVDATQVHIAD